MSAENEFEGLCERAIADPASITRAEKNRIYGWPDPEEEDILFIAKTGGARAHFIAKAVAQPEQLTRYDTDVLIDYRGIALERDRPRGRAPKPEWTVTQSKAIATLRNVDVEEKEARTAAIHRMIALDNALAEKTFNRYQQDDQWKLEQGTPWIQEMLEKGLLQNEPECWGFVLFRIGCYGERDGNTSAWMQFQDYFMTTGKKVMMQWHSGRLIWPAFRVIWVSDKARLDGATTDILRKRFEEMREAGDIPRGISTNCFLVADESALMDEGIKTPYNYELLLAQSRLSWPTVYLRAVDPRHNASATLENKPESQSKFSGGEPRESDGELAGFTGEVKIALPKVFDYLYCACFSEQGRTSWMDFDKRSGWTAIYNSTKDPSKWHLLSGSGAVGY